MKAVSPTLFPTSAPHADHVGDSTVGDEEFGAVIAAALGIAQQPLPITHTVASSSSRHAPAPVDDSRSHVAARTGSDVERSSSPDRSVDDVANASDPNDASSASASATRASDHAADAATAATAAPAKAGHADKPSDAKASDAGATPAKPAASGRHSAAPASATAQPLPKSVVPDAKTGTPRIANAPAELQAKQSPVLPKNAVNASVLAGVAAASVHGSVTSKAVSKASALQAPRVDASPVLAHEAVATTKSDSKTIPSATKTGNAAKVPVASRPTSAEGQRPVVETSTAVAAGPQVPVMSTTHGHADSPSGKEKPSNSGDAKSTTLATPANPGPTVAVAAPPAQSAPLTAPAPSAPQPAAPSTVPNQIVQVLMPLRTAKDGNYTVSLQLHPAELGPVTVRVAVHDGVLSVQLTADQQSGHDALHSSLTDLRTQLQASGLQVGDVDLGNRGAVSQQQLGNSSNQAAFGQGAQGNPGNQGSQHHSQPQYTPSGYGDGADRRPSSGSAWYGHPDDQPDHEPMNNGRHQPVANTLADAALDVRI